MSPGGYLGGLAFFAATWGGVALATWLLVRRRLVHLRGAVLAAEDGMTTLSSTMSAA